MNPLNRRDFVRHGTLAGIAGLGVPAMAAREGKSPNLLFVLPDQFRPFACGFMGADPVKTPNLDGFAKESVVFDNAVSNLPICTPYRAMLFTGRWPFQTGMYTNANSATPHISLDPEAVCLSDVLAAQGYECGYIGKLHLDHPAPEDAEYGEGKRGDGRVWDAYTPPGPRRHGFSFWHSYGCCDRHLKPHYWHNEAPREKPTQVDGWSVKHETDVALEFLQRKRDCPFALFVAYNPPHPPYRQVPESLKKRYSGASAKELLVRPNVPDKNGKDRASRSVADYFAAVEGVDENFGRLLAKLEETGLDKNTLVVFSSDHGEMMGSHSRMGKGVFYEESLRIPLFMRLPGKLRPRHEHLHINVPDMYPTLLGILGLGERIPTTVNGRDYSELLLAEKGTGPQTSFFIGAAGAAANRGSRAVRDDRYTFAISRRGLAQALLFDRREDPYQLKNIAHENPELCRNYLRELNRWLQRTDDPWPQQEWPLTSDTAFAIHREKNVVRVDFEPAGKAKELVGIDGADGRISTENPISGTRSLLADTRAAGGRWHEILRLRKVVKPHHRYELSYRYRVLGVGEKTNFYAVVRSPRTKHRAIRDFWKEVAGASGQRTVRFETTAAMDYELLFGVESQGALLWDDLCLTDLGQTATRKK